MSNASAIAAVTATLGARLTQVIDDLGISASVSHTRPGTQGAFNTSAKTGIHLFLYMVTPNAALRNFDLPTRDAGGKLTQRPSAALELHYLLSFVAPDNELDAQRMLGAVTIELNANPLLSPAEIRSASTSKSLGDTRLDQQIERVRLSGEAINLEEFSKLWSVFFQTQYLLSVAYKASVVLLEAEVEAPVPAPVRSRDVWSSPMPPTIRSVAPQLTTPGGRIRIEGTNFLSSATKLRLLQPSGELLVDPALLLDDRVEVVLPSTLAAGLTGVQVVTQHVASTSEGTQSFELESSATGLTIVPQLVDGGAPLVSRSAVAGATIALDVEPPLASGQMLVALIGSQRVAATPSPATSTTHFEVTLPDTLAVGVYPLRVIVDRTASLVGPEGSSFAPRLEVGGP